jgi:N-acetyl-anhydromuramyl-L-alanine amidase AmpD
VVFERKWRDYYFWQPYTETQIDKLVQLCKQLFDETSVNSQIIGHNTKIKEFQKQEGVITRSNYDVDFTDVSPAFNFDIFTKKIENE